MCEQQILFFFFLHTKPFCFIFLNQFLFILSINNFSPNIILICVRLYVYTRVRNVKVYSTSWQLSLVLRMMKKERFPPPHITSQLLCNALKPDQMLKCCYKCVHKGKNECRISQTYVITLFSAAFYVICEGSTE